MKKFAALENNEAQTIVIQTTNPLLNIACLALAGGIGLTFAYLNQRQSQRQPAAPDAIIPASLNTETQKMLHDILDDNFNEQELRDVCFEMDVDYEDLPCFGQANKARELIGLCARMGQISVLKTIIAEKRPHLFPEPQTVVSTQLLSSSDQVNKLFQPGNHTAHA